VERIEIGSTIGRQVNNLGINDDWLSEPRRFLDNAWIAPLKPTDCGTLLSLAR
jgi:hypothetical protein